MAPVTTINQKIYKATLPPIDLEVVEFRSLTADSISNLIATIGNETRLGIAATYGKKCVLKSLAFSTETRILLIELDGASRNAHPQKELLSQEILCNASFEKHGFFMERIAAALHLDLGNVFICNAFDISTNVRERGAMAMYKSVLQRASYHPLDEAVVKKTFREKQYNPRDSELFAIRAWACCQGVKGLPNQSGMIDTSAMDREVLNWICKCVRDADRLDSFKPFTAKNDVSDQINIESNVIDLQCTRFKTRIRRATDQHISFMTDKGTMKGRVKKAKGRSARIVPQAGCEFDTSVVIKSVSTIGKEGLTNAGMSRASLVLATFKGSDILLTSPFLRKIFFPNFPLETLDWPELPLYEPEINFAHLPLNVGQTEAVEKCLSNKEDDRHVVVVGPPGTGKTTVIAAAIYSKMEEDESSTIWVIAQSNVAVKNVAEKLVEFGFEDFKILVSADFHYDWHEHLYEVIVANTIQSGQFQSSVVDNETLLEGSRVILCTISLLSGDRVMKCGITDIVPVETIIVDEASQIEVGDYLPILAKYKPTLRKMVFIGDDKQLPPYGQDKIAELRSVFEWPHLRSNVVLLDIQYRMPTVIGGFISRHVYSSMLLTQHAIDSETCCRFIDVWNGRELKAEDDASWKNHAEVSAAVFMARRYRNERKRFKIITPYDAQRNAIEVALQKEQIAWENTVFNVDSFQGNEEDHIIISIVRTSNPGFLVDERRTNVMLSRCKRSMMILTLRSFMEGAAKKTLVGRFAEEHVPRTDWVSSRDLDRYRW